MTDPLLELQGLHKAFGALQATDGVDLTVRPGEIHALIGPNGAGKSTLIAQIAGGLAPEAGRNVLLGADVTGWPRSEEHTSELPSPMSNAYAVLRTKHTNAE